MQRMIFDFERHAEPITIAFMVDNDLRKHGADAKRVGTVNITQVKDADGKEYGKEMLTVATEGAFKEVAYKFPRPGETTPSPKSTFITKVGNQLCGVGYYK